MPERRNPFILSHWYQLMMMVKDENNSNLCTHVLTVHGSSNWGDGPSFHLTYHCPFVQEKLEWIPLNWYDECFGGLKSIHLKDSECIRRGWLQGMNYAIAWQHVKRGQLPQIKIASGRFPSSTKIFFLQCSCVLYSAPWDWFMRTFVMNACFGIWVIEDIFHGAKETSQSI